MISSFCYLESSSFFVNFSVICEKLSEVSLHISLHISLTLRAAPTFYLFSIHSCVIFVPTINCDSRLEDEMAQGIKQNGKSIVDTIPQSIRWVKK